MNPDNLRYSKNHEWISIPNEKNKAYVGITHFAQNELGDIVYLDIEDSIIGKKMKLDNSFGTIEAVKTVSDLFMPVSGFILEINKKLLSKPELINKSFYSEGWIIRIEILDLKEYNKLMSSTEYKKHIQQESN
ncbi:glycine cleavage system protein GcvH [Blattabacterium sp. (Blaberus giganteus)]|uniref:glycine cleavage system protein GcvH n=1 Tax=Blattabacterium sp. (Blaberus giganteus) TaxID=1186051 RepID=UPI00025F6EDF|nr:glycine cleavage system protein GcvH [Blattabacterium sp. (Blaberus giganteus)]AFJ90669.1 glycine cleavage system H protein [Blattabacterium sp. (Blaberus giganteus)]